MNYLIYNKKGDYTGWLGNVMFQVSATIGIARKNNLTPIFADTGYFDHKFYSHFRGNFPIAPIDELAKIHSYEAIEPFFHYQELLLPQYNYNLTGYFQSEKYWKHCEDEIRDLFQFAPHIAQKAMQSLNNQLPNTIVDYKNFVSIHVRRGDYTTQQDHHPTLTMDYYVQAAQVAASPNSVFLVFSDDPQWCKENFSTVDIFLGRVFFIEGNEPIVDMYLQSICPINIICNSTFSWWASYLNTHPDKKIIAPVKEYWFGPALKDWKVDDLYCDNWLTI